MWIELNEMELNGREKLLNLIALTETATSLRFTVAAPMAHMKVKWSDAGKGTEKWRKILMVMKRKMSLSQDAESLWTFIIERTK